MMKTVKHSIGERWLAGWRSGWQKYPERETRYLKGVNLALRTASFILCLVLSLQLEAQNIVQNGSFEELLICPTGPGELFKSSFWESSLGSPDLYNVCGDFGYSVPNNINGTQEPRNGAGYAGVGSYFEDFQDIREVMQCELLYPLVANEEYFVQFYVSLNDSAQFAVHNLGVTFTNEDTTTYLSCIPSCTIYYDNEQNNPLSSRVDWIGVNGTFTATGGERFLHLGNLRTDDDSDYEFISGGGLGPDYLWNFSAYYIDDVWLSHIDSAGYVGVGEVEDDFGFEVYPNPSSGGAVSIGCNLQGGDIAELRVFDVSGRQVYSNNEVCGVNAIELSGLSEGIYHCLLVINGKASLSEKIVILRE